MNLRSAARLHRQASFSSPSSRYSAAVARQSRKFVNSIAMSLARFRSLLDMLAKRSGLRSKFKSFTKFQPPQIYRLGRPVGTKLPLCLSLLSGLCEKPCNRSHRAQIPHKAIEVFHLATSMPASATALAKTQKFFVPMVSISLLTFVRSHFPAQEQAG